MLVIKLADHKLDFYFFLENGTCHFIGISLGILGQTKIYLCLGYLIYFFFYYFLFFANAKISFTCFLKFINFRPFSNKIIMLPYGHFEIIGLVLCGDLQVIIVYFNTKKNVLKIPNYRT